MNTRFTRLHRITKDPKLFTLLGLSVIFFFVYAYFPLTSPERFVSPDATANNYLAQRFADSSSLITEEPLNSNVENIIHPRNLGVWRGRIVPEGFVGFSVITGLIAKVFGNWSIGLVVPLLAASGPIALYLFLKKIFNSRTAFLSAALLFILPNYWYYASRSLMHTVAFMGLLLWAVYWGSRMVERQSRLWHYGLFGLFLGLALFVRTSEIFWMGIGVGVVILLARHQLRWSGITLAGVIIALCLALFIYYNYKFFGSPLAHALSSNFLGISGTEQSVSWVEKLGGMLFPFGVKLNVASHNVFDYGWRIFPWLSILFSVGLVAYGVRQLRSSAQSVLGGLLKRRYALIFIGLSLWLFLMYGSWQLQEYEDPNVLILGHSFLRYWLPFFVFGLPFVVRGIEQITSWFSTAKLKLILRAGIIMTLTVLSASLVIGDPLYGLSKIKSDSQEYQSINQEIVRQTEADSVIVAGRADKVIFPERRVIVEYLPADRTYLAALKELSRQVPIYCYSIGVEDACQGLRGRKDFPEYQAEMEAISKFANGAVLYRIQVH